MLPTFVWQHHADLLQSSSPNVVLRAWVPLNLTRGRPPQKGMSDIDAVGLELLAKDTRFRHLMGIKVPHFQFGVSLFPQHGRTLTLERCLICAGALLLIGHSA